MDDETSAGVDDDVGAEVVGTEDVEVVGRAAC